MLFFKSSEDKRIVYLVNRYLAALKVGSSEEIARINVIKEFKMTEDYIASALKGKNLGDQKNELEQLFPGQNILKYEIGRLISFLISMEYPKEEKNLVENMLQGTTRSDFINAKVQSLLKNS